ncbi:hypothetical protein TNCV_4196021 [Trichonephila clavipes]|nr:hypothetical protein TNCV_4196021 [Trichonephila clavipes]
MRSAPIRVQNKELLYWTHDFVIPLSLTNCVTEMKQHCILRTHASEHFYSLIAPHITLKSGQYSAYVVNIDVLRLGPTLPGPRSSDTMRTSSRSRRSINKIMIRIISKGQLLFLVVFSEKLGISDYMSVGYVG